MCGGGKTQQTTSQVTIPPEVLARYTAVNDTAAKAAATPFQQYSTDPNAFVAPMTATQNAGVANTNAAVGQAQPYFGAATGLALAGAGPANPGALDTSKYMNPFISSVVNPAAQYLTQQQQQAMSGQTGAAIQQGAFGGDRAGIASANLAGQQSLAFANAINPLLSQGYTQAQAVAQQQQGQQLSADQANLARLSGAGSQLASIGSGAQGAALQGAQAQLAAGTTQQQTQQAGLSALYNQFLQQQAYPFQTAQFQANIAEGTGALSGSTTTQTSPQSFFGNLLSDERAKENIIPIGKSFDGQPIYKYNYKGHPETQIGLMAQDVERVHPEAVGLAGGLKTVNYDEATKDAERPHKAGGGLVSDTDLQAIRQAGLSPFGGYGGAATVYGGAAGGQPGKGGYVPAASLPVPHLAVAQPVQRQSPMTVAQGINSIAGLDKSVSDLYDQGAKGLGAAGKFAESRGLIAPAGASPSATSEPQAPINPDNVPMPVARPDDLGLARGGRAGFMAGGTPEGLYAPQAGPALDIPDQASTAKLATSDPAKSSDTPSNNIQALSGLASLGKTAMAAPGAISSAASSIADMLPMIFLKDGGRVGLAGGGVPPSDDAAGPYDADFQAASDKYGIPVPLLKQQAMVESGMDPSKTGKSGEHSIMQILPSTARDPGYGMQGVDPATLAGPENVGRNIDFGAQYLAARGKHAGVTNWSDPEQAAKGLAAYNGGGDPNYVAKVLGRQPAAYAASPGLSPASTAINRQSPPSGAVGSQDATAPDEGGIGGLLSKVPTDRSFWVPLLTGLGAMASSNSRYLGAAALQGLGAGAQAYQGVQKQNADIANTQAATANTQAHTAGTGIDNFQKSIKDTPYGRIVFLANGQIMRASEYNDAVAQGKNIPLLGALPADADARAAAAFGPGHPGAGSPPVPGVPAPGKVQSSPLAPIGAPAPAAAPAASPLAQVAKPLPPVVPGVVYDDGSRARAKAESDVATDAGPQAAIALDRTNSYNKMTTSDAATARQNSPLISELATTVSDAVNKQGFGTPGYGANVRAEIIRAANTFSQAVGGPQLDTAASDKDIVNKISTLLGSQGAAAGGQESYAALQAIKAAIPNIEMDPNAASNLTAQLMMIKQRALDRDEHMRAYSKDSNGYLSDAPADFSQKNPDGKYTTESSIVEDLIRNRPNEMKLLMSGTLSPAQIEEALQKRYGPGTPRGISRYFSHSGQ